MTGTNNLDGVSRDMATVVMIVNKEKMCAATICIKITVGKKLGLGNIAASPYCPLSLDFVRRPFLGVEVPSTGTLPQPYRKVREIQITFYITRDRPRLSRGE